MLKLVCLITCIGASTAFLLPAGVSQKGVFGSLGHTVFGSPGFCSIGRSCKGRTFCCLPMFSYCCPEGTTCCQQMKIQSCCRTNGQLIAPAEKAIKQPVGEILDLLKKNVYLYTKNTHH